MKERVTYNTLEGQEAVYSKLGDYAQLVKLRLSLVVVMSSLLGFLIASGSDINYYKLLILVSGGMLVTFAANAMNQVLEKDFDVLMDRTNNRPIAAGRMKISEGVLFAGISCLIGISLLATINGLSALMAMLSFVLYAFVYTPMKRISTLSVAIGAIPGALPVLIGFSSVDNRLTTLAISLFIVQFLWQFPHFWAIGFLGFDDYNRAGYKLLPSTDGVMDRNVGLSSLIYTIMIVPVIFYIYYIGHTNVINTAIVLVLTILYSLFSYNFHKNFDRKSALGLMFFSFIYLPLVLLTYLIF